MISVTVNCPCCGQENTIHRNPMAANTDGHFASEIVYCSDKNNPKCCDNRFVVDVKLKAVATRVSMIQDDDA